MRVLFPRVKATTARKSPAEKAGLWQLPQGLACFPTSVSGRSGKERRVGIRMSPVEKGEGQARMVVSEQVMMIETVCVIGEEKGMGVRGAGEETEARSQR